MNHAIRIALTVLLALPLGAVADSRRDIDLVIVLDVSGSMSNLIDSAKQRLWDVVNTFSGAQPQPVLRVAIVSFGNPGYGAQSGYVRVDQPLTTDLDSVNETLFGFATNGGEEYVARAVATSIRELDWSQADDAMRVVFVAGNESAEQDPTLTLQQVLSEAAQRDIIVNTIYCGSENDALAPAWRQLAQGTQGTFASINQAANAVAQIDTPVDAKLADLSKQLNDTYLPYGADGIEHKERQADQDDNAQTMSIGALASRVITKASELYQNAQWDLVDAVEQGQRLSDIEPASLPTTMQNMPLEEVEKAVAEQSQRRAELKQEIAELDAQRRDYVDGYRAKEGAAGLDAALVDALTEQAEQRGFVVK